MNWAPFVDLVVTLTYFNAATLANAAARLQLQLGTLTRHPEMQLPSLGNAEEA